MAISQLSSVAALCNVKGTDLVPSFYNQRGFSSVARTNGQVTGFYDLVMDPQTFGELHLQELAIIVSQDIRVPLSGTKLYTINWQIISNTTLRIHIIRSTGETARAADADFSVAIYRTN